MLVRDIQRLASQKFDVLIIGGGIVGAAIAREACLSGYSVALVERRDFGGQTSSGCFKIIHGGLRYLQRLNIKSLRESMREQRAFRNLAPRLVKPQPFLIPCYGHGMRGRGLLRTAMTAYELLTPDRNSHIPPSHRLPRHHVLSTEETMKIAPGLNPEGLHGGVTFYDCQILNCERLTLAFVVDAVSRGASVANYVEVTDFNVTSSSSTACELSSTQCLDRISGKTFAISARFVINAGGPWIGDILGRINQDLPRSLPHRQLFSKGIQLVFPSVIDTTYGVAVESPYRDEGTVINRGGRSYFIVPWRNMSLVGTADYSFTDRPDEYRILPEEVNAFIAEVSAMYKSPLLTRETIRYGFGGLRPAHKRSADKFMHRSALVHEPVEVELKDRLIDHSSVEIPAQRIANLISTIGVKYTTARAVAEQAVALLGTKFGKLVQPVNSAEIPLIEAENVPAVGPVDVQVHAAVRNEMALTLSDVVLRRTELGTAGHPGEQLLAKIAHLMADDLGWDSKKIANEIRETSLIFEPWRSIN